MLKNIDIKIYYQLSESNVMTFRNFSNSAFLKKFACSEMLSSNKTIRGGGG